MSAIQRRLPEYDAIREQASQKAIADGQRGQDAIKRRFARQGGFGSGAFIKASQIAEDEANRAGQDAISNIGIAEAGEMRRREESDRGFGIQQEQLGIQKGQFDLAKRTTEQSLSQGADEFERQKMADSFNLIKAAGGTTKNLQAFLTLFNKLGRIPTAKEVINVSGDFGGPGAKGKSKGRDAFGYIDPGLSKVGDMFGF